MWLENLKDHWGPSDFSPRDGAPNTTSRWNTVSNAKIIFGFCSYNVFLILLQIDDIEDMSCKHKHHSKYLFREGNINIW